MDVVALLLAAGASSRMGQCKALLPWQGQPLIAYQLHQIQRSRVRECIVVLGPDATRVRPHVEAPLRPGWKARGVVNPRCEEGKCSSIQTGLMALPVPPEAVLVAAVDQPLDARLLNALIDAAEAEWDRGASCGRRTIIVPTFGEKRGHPPLFCGSLFAELIGVSEEGGGLKAVVRRDPARVLHLSWSDPSILVNLNALTDLPAARPDLELR